jgi:hypothetical protein
MVQDRRAHAWKLCAVERGVAVHERDDIGPGGAQAREACGTETSLGFGYDMSAERSRDRRGVISRAVVHDDRSISRRDRRQHVPQRAALVERREDDIDHARNVTSRSTIHTCERLTRRESLALLTIRET